MEWYLILLIILVTLLLLYLVVSLIIAIYVVNYVIHPYCQLKQDAIENAIKSNRLNLNEYNNLEKEEFFINSKFNYKLKATYFKKNTDITFNDNKERVVVILHGWTSNRFFMSSVASLYLKLGFHVFVYDQRNHLESDKIVTTMGNFEADDLQTVIEVIKEKLGNNIVIGTHGESMGATTCMIHAGRYHSVDFVVEDCGYTSLKEMLSYNIKYLKKLPLHPTIELANLVFKIKTKSSFDDTDATKYVATCDEIPMCFIHGDADRFVPAYMVYKNFDAKNGFKKVYLYQNSKHVASIKDHPEKYFNDIYEFLKISNIL